MLGAKLTSLILSKIRIQEDFLGFSLGKEAKLATEYKKLYECKIFEKQFGKFRKAHSRNPAPDIKHWGEGYLSPYVFGPCITRLN